jgi:hypothetical protein
MVGRRSWLLMALAAAPWAHAGALPGLGRWEGAAQVQGMPMPMVIDLDRGAGSITLPGRRVKGAPLADLQHDARGARFTLAAAFLVPGEPVPSIELRWRGRERADGVLRLGGLVAPVALRRTGDAQVDRPPASTPIADALVGTWVGRYELGGTPREVTLVLSRDAAGRGRAAMTIVGRRRTEVPFERVVQQPRFLSLRGNAFDIAVEGAWREGAIDATFEQGPFEAPLALRREDAK